MLWWLVENSIVAAMLAGIVASLCRFGRFRPAVRHALWLMVLARLVLPPVITWPWTLPDLNQFLNSEAGQATPDDLAPVASSNSEVVTTDVLTYEQLLAIPASTPDEPSPQTLAATSPGPNPPWWQAAWVTGGLMGLWVAGTAGMVLLQMLRIVRFRRRLARVEAAPDLLMRQVQKLAARLRVQAPLTLVLAGIGSPFIWSLGRPKLLWPNSLLKSLPISCRPCVILHELAHLRRRDHWVGWLQLLAECLWWWNPLFWYVRRQLRLNAELACDAWVVGTLPKQRRAYAEALIEVTQLVSLTAAPTPALGMNSSARQVFERRLTMIMRERVPYRAPVLGLVAIGLLGLLALPGWSQTENKKAETAPKKEREQVQGIILNLKDAQDTGKATIRIGGDENVGLALQLLGDLELQAKEKPAGDADRDQRLQRLEQQLQALLKEVQALRAGKPAAEKQRHTIEVRTAQQANKTWDVRVLRAVQDLSGDLVVHVKRKEQAIALSRSTYKLPHDKAEALAGFLREHVKAQVIETKVEGDSLTVTTTPDAQKAIGGLVALIQGKPVASKDALKHRVSEALFEDAIRLDAHVAPIHVERLLDLGKPIEVGKPIELLIETPKKDAPKKP